LLGAPTKPPSVAEVRHMASQLEKCLERMNEQQEAAETITLE
jgi:hypothetical protein